MPSRNIVKIYIKDGYYHVYNRGVAKQPIFLDNNDFYIFTKQLREALIDSPKDVVVRHVGGRTFNALPQLPQNFKNDISLVAYCLMPNHFHLLIQQHKKESMTDFLRSLMTRYAKYFNIKYNRVGPLFQGKYKAVLIDNDRYLLHLSRYIHQNPCEYSKDLTKAYSSYPEYLGLRETEWLKPDIILKFFNNSTIPEISKINSYKSFVEDYKKESVDLLQELTLE